MVAAAFTLTNCTQEIDAPVEPSVDGVPFEIVAKSADTKTANDGLKTVWAEGDAINLFHEYAGSEEYVKDGEFTYEGGDVFKGTLAEELEEANYNWYAIYPYDSHVNTPASTNSGYLILGADSKANFSQTQLGNNSMAHIAGKNYPLAGACIDVEYCEGDQVEIQMNHLTCLLEVVVTNNTDEDLTVETVAFTATEDIVGTYYIDIVGAKPSFTGSGVGYVQKTATLKVEGGEALANGESANFYLAVKPFTAAADTELSLYVEGFEKKVKLPAEMTFNASEKVTLNFNYNPTEEPTISHITVAEFMDLNDGPTVYELTGTITGIKEQYNSQYNNIAFYISDGTGEILIYRMSCVGVEDPTSISVGDVITVQGVKTTYSGAPQMDKGGVCISHQNACETPVITCEDNVVTITAEEGAVVYYTTNGDVPTEDSNVYTAPFEIGESVTVQAIAVIEGKPVSPLASVACVYWDPNQEKPAEVSYTALFGANYNSASISAYDKTWSATNDGFKVNLTNWNNNQNKWDYVKAGRKNVASVGTIVTDAAIPEAITKVTITVDALTVSKINSLKLYVDSDKTFANADEYSATAQQGDVVFTISNTKANQYYKIEVDCASGSSNGLFTVSKIVYSNF